VVRKLHVALLITILPRKCFGYRIKSLFYICTSQSYIALQCCLVTAQLAKIRPKHSLYFILEQNRIEYRRTATE